RRTAPRPQRRPGLRWWLPDRSCCEKTVSWRWCGFDMGPRLGQVALQGGSERALVGRRQRRCWPLRPVLACLGRVVVARYSLVARGFVAPGLAVGARGEHAPRGAVSAWGSAFQLA